MVDAGFTPDRWQAEFLRSRDQRNLMLCSRQCGKSLTVSILALHTALTRPGSTTIVVAQRQDQAAELLRKAKSAYYRIGAPVACARQGQTHFELVTGARILALPGEEKAMHGPSADCLVIDESARVPDEVFAAASPQLSVTKGRLVGALHCVLEKRLVLRGVAKRNRLPGAGRSRRTSAPGTLPTFSGTNCGSAGPQVFRGRLPQRLLRRDRSGFRQAADIRASLSAEVKPLFLVAPEPGPARRRWRQLGHARRRCPLVPSLERLIMSMFVSGLDLGQAADPTALVTNEVELIPDPEVAGQKVLRHDMRHL